jgi:thioredoxin-dependent peroxiredoxin
MVKSIPSSIKMVLVASIAIIPAAKAKEENVKVTASQIAPEFTINDVNGQTVSLANYKGKKVLLTFYRNVGCPICNLRFHQLQEQSEIFKEKGLQLLAVYESSVENMKQYLENEDPYAVMIPNPDQSLYQLYDIERSTVKLLKAPFSGAIGKMKKGKKLFKKEIKMDGNTNRIGAEFLIDENGIIKVAHYGKFLGDDLPMDEINSFLNNSKLDFQK